MKRDITVWISLGMMAIPMLLGAAMGMPRNMTADDPLAFHVFFWTMFLGAARAAVLWFQTLIHGVKYSLEENRVTVVVGHVLLGPIMAYGYYLSSRLDAMQSASHRLR